MITTRERIEGMEILYERSFLQAVRAFFNVTAPEKQSIPHFSAEYRTMVKKIVSEGRVIRWKPVTSGTEKERVNLERLRERRKRTTW